jgi:ribulose-5-phosphate 4-epimerase/fuculose-1-phosphate aldolase
MSGWKNRAKTNFQELRMEQVEELKEKLARACRMLEMVGLIDFSGHITGRVPGGKTFFIHPVYKARSEVNPLDMIEVDMEGKNVTEGNIPGETPIHAAVYRKRDDVNGVIHMHPHYTIIPSIVGRDLVTVCHHGSIFGPVVPLYPDSLKIVNFTQADRMAGILGKGRAVVMKGHGAVVAEASVEAVFVAALHLEENARLLVEASGMGEAIPLPAEEIKRASASTFKTSSILKTWSYFMEKGRRQRVFWD